MKNITFLTIVFFCISISIKAQNTTLNNVSIGTDYPAYGAQIKTNFPGYTGGWSRAYFITNESGNQSFFSLGSAGHSTNGVSSVLSNFIGKDLDTRYMTFLPNGKIGIGTSNPSKNLELYSSYATTLKISTGDPSSYATEIHLGANPDFNKSAIISAPNAAGWYRQDLYFCLANGNNTLSTGLTDAAMVIKSYNQAGFGYVGIGTISPDEKLTVKGKIHAQEVRVDMLGPLVPDYVFAEDYKLKSLQEVENFIKENKHLPEIPSAQEIEKNGLMLAEMNMSLLKKMEEMTLYMIEMKKENEIQNKKIQFLENKLKHKPNE